MALFTRQEILTALQRLGELAQAQGDHIRLVLVGGAAMVLGFEARQSTHDVDAAILSPREVRKVRLLATRVAVENDWPEDWLNDAAKGYLIGISDGGIVYTAPGIEVHLPSTSQLLAMKLSAWRDDVDISDARRLLEALTPMSSEAIWQAVEPYLVPGEELKAHYAFLDLWETLHG